MSIARGLGLLPVGFLLSCTLSTARTIDKDHLKGIEEIKVFTMVVLPSAEESRRFSESIEDFVTRKLASNGLKPAENDSPRVWVIVNTIEVGDQSDAVAAWISVELRESVFLKRDPSLSPAAGPVPVWQEGVLVCVPSERLEATVMDWVDTYTNMFLEEWRRANE